MKYAELFAGAGGLSLGLDRAGFSCAWHSEIAEFPRRVLKHRWPDTPLYGDVAELSGFELVERHGPIDLLSGGSPCQDLSVAGKRKGMTEGSGTRSSLFYEQLRLWNETGAEFLLWENVDGARSSNNGKDFGSVLSAIVGAAVFVPTDGWRSGGVAVGPKAIAAWRVLDAQFFGVPQRRRRVFVLGSRTGRVDPAEILSLSEGLRGDTASCGEAWEGIAGGVGECIEGEGGLAVLNLQGSKSNGIGQVSDTMYALNAMHGHDVHAVLSFAQNQRGELRMSDVSTSLNSGGGKPGEGYPAVLVGTLNTRTCRSVGSDDAANGHIIAQSWWDGGDVADSLGTTTDGQRMPDKGRLQAVVVGALCAKTNDCQSEQQAIQGHIRADHGIPRRLMPIECERLMGWPDNWTNVPDEKGKPASDANRYKACGNGVVSNCVQWIGERLIRAVA